MNTNDIIEKCAEVADDYAAPNRFSVADCWKDGQSPSEVYDTAAIDVGGWIAQEIRALKSTLPAENGRCLTEEQIKHLVDRFLQWRLPKDFNPDAGISYKRPNYAAEVDATPSGTNLFDAAQATDMVRFMVEGMPVSSLPAETVSEAKAEATIERERRQAEELRCYFEESLRCDFEEELKSAHARIAELEAQSSAPFVAGKRAGFRRAHKIVETFGRLAVIGNPSEHPWTRGYVTACSDLASDISRASRDEVELKEGGR